MRHAFLVLVLANCLSAGEPPVAEVLGLDLVLLDAVTAKTEQVERQSLYFRVRRVDGRWQTAVGLGYGSGYHPGRVAEATVTVTQIRMRLAVEVAQDPWGAPGGTARFDLTVTRQADGSWRGTHQGVFLGLPVHGEVVAEMDPPRRQVRPPAGRTEHPRLLFRQTDLPVLHAMTAATPSGAIFAIMTIQRGPAPQVEVQGKGLQARFTVGGRHVRLDGQRIVVE